MLARISSAATVGVQAYRVEIEVDLGRGMMLFQTVGLPAAAVCEARTRVRSALENCGYGFPQKRVIVNLAPAHIRKEGSAFDLPIALGILLADEKIPADSLKETLVVGELSLDGRIRAIRGVLPLVVGARRMGLKRALVPAINGPEAAAVEGIQIYAVEHLAQVVEALKENNTLPEPQLSAEKEAGGGADLADVKGQTLARRALEIAAAGRHNLLFIGPPGAGKTLLSRRLPSILSPMSLSERLESSSIASVAGLLRPEHPLLQERPFRAPHHSASDVALSGGGPHARPGEVSLAHNGVLFLDELPEFRRSTLETLRQPLEDGHIVVARAQFTLQYPARFMLVASMNPCPCGYLGHPRRSCECHPRAVQNYRARISGPLLDRIDLQVAIEPVSPGDLQQSAPGEASSLVRARVLAARRRQEERLSPYMLRCNAQIPPSKLQHLCALNPAGNRLLAAAVERFALSARAHDRILRVARSVADLEGSEAIEDQHVAEALQYRQLDRAC